MLKMLGRWRLWAWFGVSTAINSLGAVNNKYLIGMNSELKDLCFTKAISKLLTLLKNLKIHVHCTTYIGTTKCCVVELYFVPMDYETSGRIKRKTLSFFSLAWQDSWILNSDGVEMPNLLSI